MRPHQDGGRRTDGLPFRRDVMPATPPRSVVRLGMLSCLLLCVLPALPARAGDWSLDELRAASSWEGFGVGTMVHYRAVTKVEAEARPDLNRTIEKETKATLVEVTDEELVIRLEERDGGAWTTRNVRQPRSSGLPASPPGIEDLQPESLEIEGRSYACARKRLPDVSGVLDDPPEPGEKRNPDERTPGVVWVHPARGLLKVESSVRVADFTSTTTLVVTRLDVRHRVGTTDLACRELTWSTNRVGGRTVRLESPAVPGLTVLTTGEVEQGPLRINHRKELVDVKLVPSRAPDEE